MNNVHAVLLFVGLFSELSAYKNFSTNNHKVCSETSKRTLKLESGPDSAMLITQRRLSDHRIDWTHDVTCSFEVKGRGLLGQILHEPIGIFAVVQSMRLRRDHNTNECVDYIQFKDGQGRTSLRLCGALDAQEAMRGTYDDSEEDADGTGFYGYHRVAPLLAFDDPRGSLTVKIFIDSRPLERGERTDFTLAFTGYRHCQNVGYRMCADDRSKCIFEAFFDDGVVNCPYYDCLDEGGCKGAKVLDVEKPLAVGTHILIGSATSLVVSFVVFVVCLYSCRKYGKFCWSEHFARPAPAPASVEIAAPPAETVNLHSPAPSAPTPEDKDMPPSYESLFPPAASR